MPPTIQPLDAPATSAEFILRVRDVKYDFTTSGEIWAGTRDLVMPGWLVSPETWLVNPGSWLVLQPSVPARILEMSPIERSLDDLLGGFLAVGSVEITVDNRNQVAWSGGLLILGAPVTIWRYDREAHVAVREFDGVIDSTAMNPDWTATLRLTDFDQSVLDTPIPKRRATTALFGPTCPNVGAVLTKVIGDVNRVKLTYVVNDVPNSYFVYHVTEGSGCVVRALYRDRGNALQLMDPSSEYSVMAPGLYPDMTVLRVYKQQTQTTSGGFFDLYADISSATTAEDPNPARAFAAIVGDTTWGLGQRVDHGALAAQAATVPAGLVVDAVLGADNTQRSGREWMRQLLMLAEGRATYSPENGWSAVWDFIEPTTARMTVAAKAPFGWTMLEPGSRIGPSLGRVARGLGLRYGMNPWTDEYRYTTAVRGISDQFPGRVVTMAGDGEDRGPSDVLQDRTAADMAGDRLWEAIKSAQDPITGTVVGEAGRRLEVGDLIAFEAAVLLIPDLLVFRRVTRTRKSAGRIEFDSVYWDAFRYTYGPEALPDLVDDDAANESDGVPV